MRAAVIGLGSMGQRRIRLMKQFIPEVGIIGVDMNNERRKSAADEFDIEVFDSPNRAYAEGRFDAAFVCTAPLSHKNIIFALLDQGIHVFTELNLVSDGYDEFMRYTGSVLFLSSTLLYRKDIQYIEKKAAGERVNYIYHSGQYLPSWHPWENYKDFFVGDRRTNGCREIFAIDLPWIIRTFGRIKSFQVQKDTMSSLALDYPDNYTLMVTHENGSRGLIAVDVVSRKPARRLEVFSEKSHILWDGHPDSLIDYDIVSGQLVQIVTYDRVDRDQRYCDNIIETAYLEEILTFFDAVNQKTGRKILYDFSDDLYTLNIIDRIEEG